MDEKDELIERRLRSLAWADDDSDWSDVLRRAGPSLNRAISSQTHRRRRGGSRRLKLAEFARVIRRELTPRRDRVGRGLRIRPRLLAGTTLGVASAGVMLTLVLSAAGTSPAFAVTRNHDGTVTVWIQRSAGISGANAKLRELGIRARVSTQVPAGCTNAIANAPAKTVIVPAPSNAIANARWTIDPRRIPGGHTLVLTAGNSGSVASAAHPGAESVVAARWMQVSCPASPPGAGNSSNSGNSGSGTSGPGNSGNS
ncbi:MAG TPA: hypothetical protein VMF57_04765 [Solirubrobacteraceae bacterium]|nr:hypothetical protein [Solirubrobacteraceae bacterium]